jgi:hypothetical protein
MRIVVISPEQQEPIMSKYYALLGLPILLSSTLSACGLKQEITTTRNVAVDTLNDSIQKLEQQSGNWQNVLTETRDKLVKDGQSTLANEVSNVMSRAASDAGIEAKCYTDFLRDRSKEELIKLRATLTGEKLNLRPAFCNPTPNSIDMNIAPDRRPVIEIAGYNLTRETLKVFLVGRDSPKLDVSDKLSNPTSYLLTLNLGSNGVPLSDKSDQIIFQLPNGEEKSIGITQPVAPPPKAQFLNRRIHVTGTIDMNDDENLSSDENKNVPVDSYIDLTSGQSTAYHWEDCVGGEVQGYVEAQLQLDKDTGVVSAQGIGQYYEGTSCGRTDEQGKRPFNFNLAPGESYTYQATLEDSDGHMIYNLNFKHEN